MMTNLSSLLVLLLLTLISCSKNERENPAPLDTSRAEVPSHTSSNNVEGVEERELSHDSNKVSLPSTSDSSVEPKPIVERIKFAKGASSGEVKGYFKGYEVREYLLTATAEQLMEVNLRSDNRFAFFTIDHPASGDRIYDGSTEGMQTFFMQLPHDGDYRISILLPRAEARRNDEVHYTLEVDIR